jgi:hypothetical protein
MFLLRLLISQFVVDIVVEAIVVDMFVCGTGVLLFVVFVTCGNVVCSSCVCRLW